MGPRTIRCLTCCQVYHSEWPRPASRSARPDQPRCPLCCPTIIRQVHPVTSWHQTPVCVPRSRHLPAPPIHPGSFRFPPHRPRDHTVTLQNTPDLSQPKPTAAPGAPVLAVPRLVVRPIPRQAPAAEHVDRAPHSRRPAVQARACRSSSCSRCGVRQLLHCADVVAALEQVRCERMPKRMAGRALRQPHPNNRKLDLALHDGLVQMMAAGLAALRLAVRACRRKQPLPSPLARRTRELPPQRTGFTALMFLAINSALGTEPARRR